MSGILSVGGGGNVGASGSFYDYSIDQSLRFNDNDSAKLYFDPTVDGNKQVWTFSAWVKRGNLGLNYATFFSGTNSSGHQTDIRFDSADQLRVVTAGASLTMDFKTNRVFRDVGSWYHIVVAVDTTDATLLNRVKIYVNGVQETSLATTTCTQNSNCILNTASNQTTNVGALGYTTTVTKEFDGYMAEVHFVDGTQYAASDFGETINGVWVPKEVSGLTYGTNGFYLSFADSAAIGDDLSGNTNDFTVVNSVASDVVPDSPVNNFATLNPLFNSVSQAVLLEGNLKAETAGFTSSAFGYGATSTFAIPKDKKIYIEVECTDVAGDSWFAGFATQTSIETGVAGNTGSDGSINVYNRSVKLNGTEIDYGASAGLGGLGVAKLAAGDILGCMCDGATGKVWFSRNGTYFKTPTTDDSGTTGDPDNDSHEIGTLTNGTTEDIFLVLGGGTNANNIFVNFGQDSTNVASAESDANGLGTFEYAPPTDYVCLAASSLSEPTIGPNSDTTSDQHFDTVLFNGTGANQTISGFNFQPDFVWNKTRNEARHHTLNDSVRGGGHLKSSNTDPEAASTISAYNSDGYDWTYNAPNNWYTGSATVVSWAWKAGGTAVSNTDGSITSQVSANQDAGFSIVSYTGTGANATVGHGLSSAPDLVIVKNRSITSSWLVRHSSDNISNTPLLENTTSGIATNYWQTTQPTSSVFSVSSNSEVNGSGNNLIAYCFHDVDGFSKFGKYVGNGSADGTFIYTGFRPAFWMMKSISDATHWVIYDSARDPYNTVDLQLIANQNIAESDQSRPVDFLSNGVKIRFSSYLNDSGQTYIYLAFAEAGGPFKYSRAR